MSREVGNIKKHHYRVMHRVPASFTVPPSAAEFTTFLATFTELGYCRDKTIQSNVDDAEAEVLDDGKEKKMGFNGHLEGLLLQAEIADYTAYETIEGVKQDVLYYSETTLKCIFYPEALLYFSEAVTSGETETVPYVYNALNLPTKAAFRTRFDESEV